MTVGLLSLPAELICHILLLLTPRDICRCSTTCKTICDVARDSVRIQYKLELYAQGFMETTVTTLDQVDISTNICSLKKLTSLWQSDFYAKTIFEEVVALVNGGSFIGAQFMKCGVWWMWADYGDGLFIRDCNANVELFQTWPIHNAYAGLQFVRSTIDPLQDLVITVYSDVSSFVVNARQDCNIFQVNIQLVVPTSVSGLSMRFLRVHTLECTHTFHESSHNPAILVGHPMICGERVVLLYYVIHETADLFIQVIDWRKGHANSYPLRAQFGSQARSCLLDKQTMVVICGEGHLMLYTLRELDGSPRHRVTYLLPKQLRYYLMSYEIHSTPLFHGTVARPDLIHGYVPSLESQIIVLEVLPLGEPPFILVIDAAIFSEGAIQSETPVEIPWSDWGSKYACCFPHHPSHLISVFGSKMAYALPLDRTPEPGEIIEKLSDHSHFYVHIWDFNKRAVARVKNANDCNPLIRKPGLVTVAQSCFIGNMFSDRYYTATVCRTPFVRRGFEGLFLEEDRLTLTWFDRSRFPRDIHWHVISPV